MTCSQPMRPHILLIVYYYISNNIIRNLLHQIRVQHNDNRRKIKKSHSRAAEEILDYGVVSGASCHILQQQAAGRHQFAVQSVCQKRTLLPF